MGIFNSVVFFITLVFCSCVLLVSTPDTERGLIAGAVIISLIVVIYNAWPLWFNNKFVHDFQTHTQELNVFPLYKPIIVRLFLILAWYAVAAVAIFGTRYTSFPLEPTIMILLFSTTIFSYLFPGWTELGNSMHPTIQAGDAMLGRRITKFSAVEFKRGDIVGFKVSGEMLKLLPDNTIREKNVIHTDRPGLMDVALNKRIVGLPNDQIEIKDENLYINDSASRASWGKGFTIELRTLKDIGYKDYCPFSGKDEPIIVPPDHYFVLGDNHVDSNLDSHIFGFVNHKSIFVKFRYLFWREGKLCKTVKIAPWSNNYFAPLPRMMY
jgi:signal peptidase I